MGIRLLAALVLTLLSIGNSSVAIKPTHPTYLSFFKSDAFEVSVDPASIQRIGVDERKVVKGTFRFDIVKPVVTPEFTIKYTIDDIAVYCNLRALLIKNSSVYGTDNKLVVKLTKEELMFQEYGTENYVQAIVDGACGKTDAKSLDT